MTFLFLNYNIVRNEFFIFKGTQRRKKKIVHKTATDDKKLQNTLKRLGVNSIQSVEEVNMIKDDGHVLHFVNPKGDKQINKVTNGQTNEMDKWKKEWMIWTDTGTNGQTVI